MGIAAGATGLAAQRDLELRVAELGHHVLAQPRPVLRLERIAVDVEVEQDRLESGRGNIGGKLQLANLPRARQAQHDASSLCIGQRGNVAGSSRHRGPRFTPASPTDVPAGSTGLRGVTRGRSWCMMDVISESEGPWPAIRERRPGS
jgi:hypothetical protein